MESLFRRMGMVDPHPTIRSIILDQALRPAATRSRMPPLPVCKFLLSILLTTYATGSKPRMLIAAFRLRRFKSSRTRTSWVLSLWSHTWTWLTTIAPMFGLPMPRCTIACLIEQRCAIWVDRSAKLDLIIETSTDILCTDACEHGLSGVLTQRSCALCQRAKAGNKKPSVSMGPRRHVRLASAAREIYIEKMEKNLGSIEIKFIPNSTMKMLLYSLNHGDQNPI